MRCYICDDLMHRGEIKIDPINPGSYLPCQSCRKSVRQANDELKLDNPEDQ